MINRNTKRGFTLIELLVVISIIGLLSSIILASLRAAASKGYDAAKIEQIHSLQTALELYRNTYGTYPLPAGSDLYQLNTNVPTFTAAGYMTTNSFYSASDIYAAGGFYAENYRTVLGVEQPSSGYVIFFLPQNAGNGKNISCNTADYNEAKVFYHTSSVYCVGFNDDGTAVTNALF